MESPRPTSRHHRIIDDHLADLRFPVRTEDVVRYAREAEVPAEVQAMVRRLPAGRRFDDADDLASELPA